MAQRWLPLVGIQQRISAAICLEAHITTAMDTTTSTRAVLRTTEMMDFTSSRGQGTATLRLLLVLARALVLELA